MHESIVKHYAELGAKTLGVKTPSHITQAGRSIQQGGESLMIGGALGALDGTIGLDQKGVPLDLAASALGFVAATAFPDHANVDEARNAAAAAAAVFAFRKTRSLVAKKGGTTAKVHGEAGADPDVSGDEDAVIAAARRL